MKRIKLFDAPEIKSFDDKTRTMWHKISAEVKDRMGDIVRIDGMDDVDFQKKPTVLYGHQYTGMNPLPIIGANIGFEKTAPFLWAGTKFLTPDDIKTPSHQTLLEDLWTLNKMKLLGWSIGFMPKEAVDMMEGGRFVGYDFKTWSLLEYSNVIIPANQEAVNNAVKTGAVSKEFGDAMRIPMGSVSVYISKDLVTVLTPDGIFYGQVMALPADTVLVPDPAPETKGGTTTDPSNTAGAAPEAKPAETIKRAIDELDPAKQSKGEIIAKMKEVLL